MASLSPRPRASRRGSARRASPSACAAARRTAGFPDFRRQLDDLWQLLADHGQQHGLQVTPVRTPGRSSEEAADRTEVKAENSLSGKGSERGERTNSEEQDTEACTEERKRNGNLNGTGSGNLSGNGKGVNRERRIDTCDNRNGSQKKGRVSAEEDNINEVQLSAPALEETSTATPMEEISREPSSPADVAANHSEETETDKEKTPRGSSKVARPRAVYADWRGGGGVAGIGVVPPPTPTNPPMVRYGFADSPTGEAHCHVAGIRGSSFSHVSSLLLDRVSSFSSASSAPSSPPPLVNMEAFQRSDWQKQKQTINCAIELANSTLNSVLEDSLIMRHLAATQALRQLAMSAMPAGHSNVATCQNLAPMESPSERHVAAVGEGEGEGAMDGEFGSLSPPTSMAIGGREGGVFREWPHWMGQEGELLLLPEEDKSFLRSKDDEPVWKRKRSATWQEREGERVGASEPNTALTIGLCTS